MYWGIDVRIKNCIFYKNWVGLVHYIQTTSIIFLYKVAVTLKGWFKIAAKLNYLARLHLPKSMDFLNSIFLRWY